MEKICLGLFLALTVASAQSMIEEEAQANRAIDHKSREGLSVSEVTEQNRRNEEIDTQVIAQRETQIKAQDREDPFATTEALFDNNVTDTISKNSVSILGKVILKPIDPDFINTTFHSDSNNSDKLVAVKASNPLLQKLSSSTFQNPQYFEHIASEQLGLKYEADQKEAIRSLATLNVLVSELENKMNDLKTTTITISTL